MERLSGAALVASDFFAPGYIFYQEETGNRNLKIRLFRLVYDSYRLTGIRVIGNSKYAWGQNE